MNFAMMMQSHVGFLDKSFQPSVVTFKPATLRRSDVIVLPCRGQLGQGVELRGITGVVLSW